MRRVHLLNTVVLFVLILVTIFSMPFTVPTLLNPMIRASTSQSLNWAGYAVAVEQV
ncbi:MAG: hypothetical protein QXP36_06575 [Conexivisphaerales archaeon]